MTKKRNSAQPPKTLGATVPEWPAFPIVGIGASAGGLAAFEAFFSGMPADTEPGMAFVLVQHLDPSHKSLLSELMRRYTRMQVFEVEDGMPIRINCVYIIPPNRDMACSNATLRLLEPSAPRGQRLPIDFFFRSLASALQERAIGVVLSGTGHDGALGVHAIKDAAGVVMVQLPKTAEFDGMPRSAIATGKVDFVIGPEEMLPRLLAFMAHPHLVGQPSDSFYATRQERAFQKIFALLKAQTGHNFAGYKVGTVHRRIERRMAVLALESVDSYASYMQHTPAEIEALFRDMLIGVTSFFRDKEAFDALQRQIIPALFLNKPSSSVLRIWVAGCSTGEEAYSIAILLQEHMQGLKQSYKVQIFASDIDSRAVAAARAGRYPASAVADISPERLERFFSIEPGGDALRINKIIRDMLVFSEQDLIKDPPFSKIDLISCRNLLIYLGADLQKKVIPVFHYALKPDGMLFLGTSEGVSNFTDLFTMIDRKAKLYQRKIDFRNPSRLPLGHAMPAHEAAEVALSRNVDKADAPAKLPLRELTERALLQQIAPVAALTDEHGDILFLHGRTGMYLEPSAGESGVNNILKMARDGLRPALSTALHNARIHNQTVRSQNVRVKTNGHFTAVNLTISVVTSLMDASLETPLFLIRMEEAAASSPQVANQTTRPAPDNSTEVTATDYETHIAALYQELRAKDEFLQSAHEELESSSEELKSSNEEMQSINEELQSTNEELETSKEELQSTNEELATVNAELQTKVIDLSRSNGDMNNLLAGTGIGTVFVDFELRILRFTPAASSIINLIPSDMGRPVAHIVSNIVNYDSLIIDVRSVLDTLIHKEVDVQTREGKWYTMRIQPYRTLDNVIEGAVISFIEITERKLMQEALRVARDQLRLAVVLRDASDAITVQDLYGRITAWNPGAERLYGWSEEQALLMDVRNRIPPEQRDREIDKLMQLSRAEVLQPYLTQRLTQSGAVLEVSVVATGLLNDAGQLYAIATTERGIAKRTSP
jgi:two-component system CheB/CheR fusion protein